MIRLLLCLYLLLQSQSLGWSDENPIVFDPRVSYDIYFKGSEDNVLVIRRVRVVEEASIGQEQYLVVKGEKPSNDPRNQAYIFLKGIYSILPSDRFSIESVSDNDRKEQHKDHRGYQN
ncbi:MAG: hypothetical protein HY209_05020 [Candidatus Omnitrophica bacterium]|nr:hypothetical protein [Candidatus Omnitrophota bacterium]